jgi:short-subunit dehydrogenase
LLLAGRNSERLQEIAADLRARGASWCETEALDLAVAENASTDFERIITTLGGVDYVLLFYGILGDQVRAERDPAHAQEILKVNFSSAAAWSLAAAELLEKQRHGSLVVVGSVAGDRGRQSNYVYGAAKAGLAVLIQGIAHRLALRTNGGARAVLVKPGFVDTPMTAGLNKGGPLWATPQKVAKIIQKAAETGGPVVYAPWFWRFILLIIRLLPSPLFHKLRL